MYLILIFYVHLCSRDEQICVLYDIEIEINKAM